MRLRSQKRMMAEAMLFGLERANLFIVPMDESRQWYRYEHLFADLLQSPAAVGVGAGRLQKRCTRRPARWYETNGFWEDAMQSCPRGPRLAEGDGGSSPFTEVNVPRWGSSRLYSTG